MEFLAGIIFTLFIGFIGYKFDLAIKRKKARAAYIPPNGSRPVAPGGDGRPKDYQGGGGSSPE